MLKPNNQLHLENCYSMDWHLASQKSKHSLLGEFHLLLVLLRLLTHCWNFKCGCWHNFGLYQQYISREIWALLRKPGPCPVHCVWALWSEHLEVWLHKYDLCHAVGLWAREQPMAPYMLYGRHGLQGHLNSGALQGNKSKNKVILVLFPDFELFYL